MIFLWSAKQSIDDPSNQKYSGVNNQRDSKFVYQRGELTAANRVIGVRSVANPSPRFFS